ncbi:uncharacterized protein LOC115622210 [Scaptodrosophila lebanonensis]|uniref:Uncharacterized protein LOC115622210 n=1 Tax=Drosophila lebanonensis TaxID=7225 RepID=A0A6J2T4V2_DROLE|nr:uncharacterized protein LOC115622210 [Scaptodrosophila lebanonensis]
MKSGVRLLLPLALLFAAIAIASARIPRVLPQADEGVIVSGDCEFRVNGDLNDPAPLFARYNSYEIIVPDPTDTVRLQNGELLDMYCTNPDGFKAPFEQRSRVTAQCLQQKYFLVDGLIYPFANFSCEAWPTYTARRTGRECNGGTDLVEVGFEVDDGGFLQTYDVCHDEVAEVTRYVHHVLYPSSFDYQHGVARPNFLELDFYGGKDVNTMYTQVQQNITISEILGLDASPYFNYTEDRILARGHMIAKTDQIFGSTQMSTFLFINVAPQWQTFNGGNWEKVETSVRKFVADRNLTTDCYTGTWGVSTLPDVEGVPKELYLNFDENNNGLIPVPRLYFRIIIDRASREGVVLIGVNNPYASLEEIMSDYVVCEDIGNRLSWVTWEKEDLNEGYSYACAVEDFTAVVKDLPLEDLQTSGILGLDDLTTTEVPTTEQSSSPTTEEPSTTTEPPSSTTEEPSSTTEEPSSTTEEPSPTTEQPSSTTELPSSSTTASTTQTTEEPSSTTEEPSSTTELPSSSTTASTTHTTEEPSSTTEEPSSTTVLPTSPTTASPSPTTEEPISTTEAPSSPTTAPAGPTTEPAPTPTLPSPTSPEPTPNTCYFNINGDLNDPAPLFTPDGALSWLLPDDSGRFVLNEGESLELHCTGALIAPFNRFTALTAQCLGNQSYLAEGLEVAFNRFSCQSWPTYVALRTGQECAGGTELVNIGFDVAAGFLPHIELCFDELTQITRYVRYELTPANVAYQRDVSQPGFLRGDFYSGKDVNLLYEQSHQQEIFSETLGVDASIYFDSSRDLYLTRGQLAPRQNFVHGSAQRATHFYVNAVPQWRSVNIGNWQRIQRSVRDYVADQGLNVSVHAGSWSISTLPNSAGEETPLYLDYLDEEKQQGRLPVPRLVYSIIIDQESRAGIALVVVNNPHASLSNILEEYVVCEDVGVYIDWIDWDRLNLPLGYSYACDVQDFIKVVQDLPVEQLHTTGLLGVNKPSESGCSLSVNGADFNDPAPLFVVREGESGKANFVEPNAEGVVELLHGERLELHCTDAFIAPFQEHRQLEATCEGTQQLRVLGSVFSFSDFVCSAWPKYAARRTGRECNGGTDLAEVGFELATKDDFLHLFDACHDENVEVTRYVHHVLTPSSAQYQRSVGRPTFVTGDFYDGKDVNGMYTQVQQQLTIAEILGTDVTPYFNISGNVYLARGHLAAKTDFIFGSPQRATFFFINAAPQWQNFNAGNWERVEDSVRKYVASEGLTVDCYTGTWGVSTLPDVNGVPTELYLNFDKNNNGLIPVPRLYYRVIIDRESRNGIVLIGVNNPHIDVEEIKRDYLICEDIGDQLSWVSWTKDDLNRGYSYACTVDDFTAVVKDLPLEDLQVNGILGV